MKQKMIKLTEAQVAMVAIVLQEVVNRGVFKSEAPYKIFDLDGIAKTSLNDLAIELRNVKQKKRA